jgi:hypothetical protein
MKKAFLFACLFSLPIIQACKQSIRNQIFPLGNSLLWEVSGKGLKSSSYLFGTNHLVGKNFADSLKGIGEKFNMCKAVAGEFIIDTAALRKPNSDMLSIYYPLSKIFSPVEFASVDKSLKQVSHFKLIDFDSVKPMFIELLIINSIAPKTISPVNPELDIYFQDEGKKHGYKVMGLETFEFQSNLIFNTSIDVQKKNLLSLSENIDSARKNLILLTKLYKEQDLKGIDKLMFRLEEYDPEESDKMLKDRNLKWTDKIPKIINKQPTFIYVGVAHLIREYGLINQLRLKGYTVKPVKI